MNTIVPRISERSELDPHTGCLRWMGATTSDGYGVMSIDGKTRRVHIAAYEQEVGPVPPGHTLDHVKARGCRFRDCWNHEHLEPVPVAVNSRRVIPWNRTKTHCPAGHDYTRQGVRYRCADGYMRRYCLVCARQRNAKRHWQKAVAS